MILSRDEKRELNIRKAQCLNIANKMMFSFYTKEELNTKTEDELYEEMIRRAEKLEKKLEEKKYWLN